MANRFEELRNALRDRTKLQICDSVHLAADAKIVIDPILGNEVLSCTFTVSSENLPIIGIAPNIAYPDELGLYQTAISAYSDVSKLARLEGNVADHTIQTDGNIKLLLLIGVWMLSGHTEVLCFVQKFLECTRD